VTLGDYPLVQLEFPSDYLDLRRMKYSIWLWTVEEGAFACPVEPLTQEFWKANAEARLANGLFLPASDHQRGADLLVLVTQKHSASHHAKFGGMSVRHRYRFFRYIMELGLPNTEPLTRLHPLARVTYLRTLEETFYQNILPIKKGYEDYRHPSFYSDDLFLPQGEEDRIACPRCKQPGHLRENLSLQGWDHIDEDEVRVYCVCEACEQPFSFHTLAKIVNYL
jgi:hypothetical protein